MNLSWQGRNSHGHSVNTKNIKLQIENICWKHFPELHGEHVNPVKISTDQNMNSKSDNL